VILLAVNISIKQKESHPKNLLLQAQHFIRTGVPSPGNVRALVTAVSGTSFRFSAAVRSSFVSLLPHFGQRAENTLNFGGRFRFMCDARMTANDRTQPRRADDVNRESGTECAIRRWLQ
jgi:hypothetical protein